MKHGLLSLALFLLIPAVLLAHPGSGIVIDPNGNIIFVDTGDIDTHWPGRVWKVDRAGNLSLVYRSGAHWLVQDVSERFAKTDLRALFDRHEVPFLERIPAAQSMPALIQADGCPLATDNQGNLYFVSGEKLGQGGGFQISRLSPDGKVIAAAPKLLESSEKLGGIKGLAVGPEQSLYVSYPGAILKVAQNGDVSTIANPVTIDECDRELPPGESPPFLRGLAVVNDGTVYAAATGCRCIVKISADGRSQKVLKAEAPWSPTGLAIADRTVYVLEYTNANGFDRSQWRPRVRRLDPDERVTTIVEISNETKSRDRN
jgi:DNA-binding beta-propeller fold protein YncE